MIKAKTKRQDNVQVVLERNDTGEPIAWIDFKPFSTLGHGAGQRTAITTLAAGEDLGTATVGYTIALARWGAIGWEGIGDEDGEPLEFSADNLQVILELNREIYAQVDREYAEPALAEEAEKNGSALPPGGTSRGSSRAKPAGARGSAAVTTAAPAKRSAKRAPTSKPRR